MADHLLEMGRFEMNGLNTQRMGQCQTGSDVLDLHIDKTTGEPIIISTRTGRKWRLQWSDICDIATNVGISNNPDKGH